MKQYIDVLKKYVDFKGRASRKEFWMFTLFNIIFSIVASLIDTFVVKNNFKIVNTIYGLAVLVPSIAVSVRRLHDTGRSWTWFLLPFAPIPLILIPSAEQQLILVPALIGIFSLIIILFEVQDSQPGDNKYGPNPKGVQA
jgi:uncharacterized membrane protein YhaH (DUF805 family)